MKRKPSHVKKRNKSPIPLSIAVLLIFGAALVGISNLQLTSEPLKKVPVLGSFIQKLDFTPATSPTSPEDTDEEPARNDGSEVATVSARIPFTSESADSGAPAYMIRDGVSPRRLEFTLYNVRTLDIDAIRQALNDLDLVKNVYKTIVLDDSTRAFTIELSSDVTWEASEYSTEGYIDLTLTKTGADSDDILYIVRSEPYDMGEDIASLAESVADFSPSIVKTRGDKYCVVAGACSTEDEANGILELLSTDFFIEECSIFSNPE